MIAGTATDAELAAIFRGLLAPPGSGGRGGSAPPALADLAAAMAADPAAWERRLAEAGLLAWPRRLELAGALAPAPPYRDWAAAAAARVAATATVASAAADALGIAGIGHRVLKGGVAAALLYPEPSLRPSRDVDLLVAPGDLGAAATALGRVGYVPCTPRPPRHNFEWSFRARDAPAAPLIDLHHALCPTWRIPWAGHRELLALPPTPGPSGSGPTAADSTAPLHAQHALVHFAGHKGVVRAVQEADLVLWTRRGQLGRVPRELGPAAALWRLRWEARWAALPEPHAGNTTGSSPVPAAGRRRALLRLAAPAGTARPGPGQGLRERYLGLVLSSSVKGWLGQAVGLSHLRDSDTNH